MKKITSKIRFDYKTGFKCRYHHDNKNAWIHLEDVAEYLGREYILLEECYTKLGNKYKCEFMDNNNETETYVRTKFVTSKAIEKISDYIHRRDLALINAMEKAAKAQAPHVPNKIYRVCIPKDEIVNSIKM